MRPGGHGKDEVLDRLSTPNVIDEVNAARDQEDYPRALRLIDDALASGMETAELHVQSIGIAFVAESWRQVLERLLTGLAKNRLAVLCKDANRKHFLRLVHEYSGFRNGLTDFFLGYI